MPDTNPSFCLNCKRQLDSKSVDNRFCDSICQHGFNMRAINAFNKEYVKTLW